MTFKVTVVNKFSENVLHKGRNGAGVKAQLFFIRFDKMFGKHHVSDTKRRRDRFGKGMKKEYRCTLRTKKMRLFTTASSLYYIFLLFLIRIITIIEIRNITVYNIVLFFGKFFCLNTLNLSFN